MLFRMNRASRRADKYCQSPFAALPAAKVRARTPIRLVERIACRVLTPSCASLTRRSSLTRQAGRYPGRRTASS